MSPCALSLSLSLSDPLYPSVPTKSRTRERTSEIPNRPATSPTSERTNAPDDGGTKGIRIHSEVLALSPAHEKGTAQLNENYSVAISAPVFRELPLRRAPPSLSPAMSDRQEVLRAAWLEGQQGRLSAQGEARAWALREAWETMHKTAYGMWSLWLLM